MKNILLLACAALQFWNANGQNNLVGVKCGLRQTNVIAENFLAQHDPKTGVSAGLTYEYRFRNRISMGAELMYSQQGFTNDFTFTDASGNPTGEKYQVVFNYNYVAVPLKAGYRIGSKRYVFANLGAVPGVLVDAVTSTPIFDNNGKFTRNDRVNVTKRVSRFDLAGLVEVGAGYEIRPGLSLFGLLAYQQSVTSITNTSYFANSKINHLGVTFALGVMCALKKG